MNEDKCRIEILNPLGYINISAKGYHKSLHSDIDKKIVVRRRQKIIRLSQCLHCKTEQS